MAKKETVAKAKKVETPKVKETKVEEVIETKKEEVVEKATEEKAEETAEVKEEVVDEKPQETTDAIETVTEAIKQEKETENDFLEKLDNTESNEDKANLLKGEIERVEKIENELKEKSKKTVNFNYGNIWNGWGYGNK